MKLDLIIKDGLLMICEIKSSMSKADIHIFHRKISCNENWPDKKAEQKTVISPMVHDLPKEKVPKMGIKIYGYAEDVDPKIYS